MNYANSNSIEVTWKTKEYSYKQTRCNKYINICTYSIYIPYNVKMLFDFPSGKVIQIMKLVK